MAVPPAQGPLPDEEPQPLTPAARLAAAHVDRPPGRAYPPAPDDEDDRESTRAVHAATKALLRVRSADDVVAVVRTLVEDLGAQVVPARTAEGVETLPLDLSLGVGEPLLATVDPVSVARMRLGAVLPSFLEDARVVLTRLRQQTLTTEEAEHDVLTRLLSRRAWMRRLALAGPGDAVFLLDADRFKQVNDRLGHAAGDAVLAAIGGLLIGSLRPEDACGRYGGDELGGVVLRTSAPLAVLRLDQVRADWAAVRPPEGADVTLSIGVAAVREDGPLAALHAADAALYRAKQRGRDRTVVAGADDYPRRGAADG